MQTKDRLHMHRWMLMIHIVVYEADVLSHLIAWPCCQVSFCCQMIAIILGGWMSRPAETRQHHAANVFLTSAISVWERPTRC